MKNASTGQSILSLFGSLIDELSEKASEQVVSFALYFKTVAVIRHEHEDVPLEEALNTLNAKVSNQELKSRKIIPAT